VKALSYFLTIPKYKKEKESRHYLSLENTNVLGLMLVFLGFTWQRIESYVNSK
jgi:hypothetical protein